MEDMKQQKLLEENKYFGTLQYKKTFWDQIPKSTENKSKNRQLELHQI